MQKHYQEMNLIQQCCQNYLCQIAEAQQKQALQVQLHSGLLPIQNIKLCHSNRKLKRLRSNFGISKCRHSSAPGSFTWAVKGS